MDTCRRSLQRLFTIYKKGKNAENYNIGSGNNISNLNLTKLLLKIVNKNKILIGKSDNKICEG